MSQCYRTMESSDPLMTNGFMSTTTTTEYSTTSTITSTSTHNNDVLLDFDPVHQEPPPTAPTSVPAAPVSSDQSTPATSNTKSDLLDFDPIQPAAPVGDHVSGSGDVIASTTVDDEVYPAPPPVKTDEHTNDDVKTKPEEAQSVAAAAGDATSKSPPHVGEEKSFPGIAETHKNDEPNNRNSTPANTKSKISQASGKSPTAATPKTSTTGLSQTSFLVHAFS